VSGHLDTVKVLLESKADVNAPNADGTTPLMVASQGGHKEIVKLLLAKDVDVNAKDKTDGRTALWHAAQNGHTEIVELLKKAGAKE
jgi:ankyrin repeat protein